MTAFNIYLTGVGGQGIGLLSEVLLRAGDHAGLKVKGVDTHGLAQRGGIVVSRLRFGDEVFSPLIMAGRADMVVALERHEAVRGMNTALKDSGVLVYYDALWQPLEVRLKDTETVTNDSLDEACRRRNVTRHRVFRPGLADARMQNVILLAHMAKNHLAPGLEAGNYRAAMDDLMAGRMLEKNLALFEEVLAE